MTPYTFTDKQVQDEWRKFAEPTYNALREIRDHLPKRPNPDKHELDELIVYIMDKTQDVAEWLGKLESFRDVAMAEVMLRIENDRPGGSTTLSKIQAKGETAQITAILAHAHNVWSSLSGTLMGAQSMLRKLP